MQEHHPHKNAKNQANAYETTHRNAKGNAVVIILVMIALLAALTFATMRSSSRTSSNMDSEQARVMAEKLMRLSKTLETGVQNAMITGHCSENEISFENDTTTRDYTNAGSPSDNHCKLFDADGPGLSYSNPDQAILDSSQSAETDYGEWVFTGTQCILGLGSDDDDSCTDNEVALIAAVPHINLAVCLQINNLNGITNPSGAPPQEEFDSSTTPFTGTFSASTDAEIGEGVSGTNLKSHATGCFEINAGAWSGSYVFYHTLNTR